MVERLRGRRGVEQRKRDRALHPFCERCKAQGRITLTEEIDHRIPLAKGGTDHPSNKRGLCKPCHKIVTAEAFAGGSKRIGCDEDGWPLT